MTDIKQFNTFEIADVPGSVLETRDWYAWNDLMPPPTNEFHIIGQVQIPNPGVLVDLKFKHPQGINTSIVLLDLILIQRPGNWPTYAVWEDVRYDRTTLRGAYSDVNVFYKTDCILNIAVDNIH